MLQMTVARRQFEALAFKADGAITAALFARRGAAKGATQGLGVRTVTPNAGGMMKALQGGCMDLAMQVLVVFLFYSGLSQRVEPVQR